MLGSVHQCPIVQYLEYVTLALRDWNGDQEERAGRDITTHITHTHTHTHITHTHRTLHTLSRVTLTPAPPRPLVTKMH